MNEELYAYDRHQGHHIYTTLDNGKFWSEIYFNGTNIKTISSHSYERALCLCKEWVEKS